MSLVIHHTVSLFLFVFHYPIPFSDLSDYTATLVF